MATTHTRLPTMACTLAEKIHRDILSSGLKAGDLFMTSEQVAQRYDASRTVVREALSQLRALGVLRGRQRRGVLVAQPDPIELSARWVPMFGRSAGLDGFRRLAEWRFVLEAGAVDLAVEHATPDQLARLHRAADDFAAVASTSGHSREADKLDLAFHAIILEMTGNPLVAGMHRVVADYFHTCKQFNTPPEASKAIRDHHTIAEAFAQGDLETARSILRAHLRSTLVW
jgi:GntR family transcriptional repressor for pyruvate dehydrogenase complex